jgi:hypothetical protein
MWGVSIRDRSGAGPHHRMTKVGSTSGESSIFGQVDSRGLGLHWHGRRSTESAFGAIFIFIVEERIELSVVRGLWWISVGRLLVLVVRRIRLGYEADKVVAHRHGDGVERVVVTEI